MKNNILGILSVNYGFFICVNDFEVIYIFQWKWKLFLQEKKIFSLYWHQEGYREKFFL